MENLPLKELLEKYNSGNCTEQERVWVENWYIQQGDSSFFPISPNEFEQDMNEVYNMLPLQEDVPNRTKRWPIAAALIGTLLIVGVSMVVHKQYVSQERGVPTSVSHDLDPGGTTAKLRLADNSVIQLNDLKIGEVYQHPGFRIRKTENGIIEYLDFPNEKRAENTPLYNEVSTPKGGQFQVVLPDGSKVWLNASTKLKYPIQFSAHERLVELSGEAYFEVNKSAVPFYVQTQQQKVQVLGTHFNVHAYQDEQEVKTTLVEGVVKIISALGTDPKDRAKEVLLKPGEQSILTNTGMRIKAVDVDQQIAWKNGFFSFQGTEIEEVMRQLSRWYSVDVQFVGNMPNTKLWGEIYRDVKASEALKILEYFDLKFKIVKEKEVSRIEISEK